MQVKVISYSFKRVLAMTLRVVALASINVHPFSLNVLVDFCSGFKNRTSGF